MASAAASGEFHKTFQALKADVVTALEADPPSSSETSKRLATVRGALQVALPTLPTYDQRNYDLQIRDLESRLARLRATEKPKQRFAFASRPASRATSSSTSVTSGTSGTSTPVHGSLISSTSSPAPAPAFPSAGIGIISGSSLSAVPSASAHPAAGPSRAREEHTLSNLSHRLVRPPRLSPPGAGGTSIHPAPSGDVQPLPLPSSPIGYTLSLESLESCYVDLRPAPRPSGADPNAGEAESAAHRLTTLHVKGLRRSVLVAPVVRGSVMLSEVHDSVIILGGQQFRMHSSSNTAVLLHVASLPVIEHSHGIRFGSYPVFLNADGPFQSASQHESVQDFDWPQGGVSPNWSLLPERQSLLPEDLPPPPPPAPAPAPPASSSASASPSSSDNASSHGATSTKGVEEIVRNVLARFGIAQEGDGGGVQHVDTSN